MDQLDISSDSIQAGQWKEQLKGASGINTLCLEASKLDDSITSIANTAMNQLSGLRHLVIKTDTITPEQVSPSHLSELAGEYETITYGNPTPEGAHVVMHITPQGVNKAVCHNVTAQFLQSFTKAHEGITTLEDHNTSGHRNSSVERVIQNLPALKNLTLTLKPGTRWEYPVHHSVYTSGKALESLTISGDGKLCDLPQHSSSIPVYVSKIAMIAARQAPVPIQPKALSDLDLSNYKVWGQEYTPALTA